MRSLRTVFLAFCLSLWAGVAFGQPSAPEQPNYENWETLASRAERTVETENASNEELERLRESVARFRAQVDEARVAHAPRIATLNDQIEALGEVPENGEEPPAVTQRRAELTAQLQALQGPAQVAEAAFRRADGLIGEIDAIIRERQAQRLLSLGPSPLNPSLYPTALRDLELIGSDLLQETRSLKSPLKQRDLRENLPLILFLTVVGLILIIRGPRWANTALRYLRRLGGRGSGVWKFLVSLLRIFLPLAGLMIVMQAIKATGVGGERINRLLDFIPIWGGILLGFRWLAERLFARDEGEALIPLSADNRKRARWLMSMVSLMLVSRGLIAVLVTLDKVAPSTLAVLAFPVFVVMGTALFGIGVLLRKCTSEPDETQRNQLGPGILRALRAAGTLIVIVSIAAPVMAAIGYAEAGNFLLYPTVLSLFILGMTMALQQFSADVYGLVTGKGDKGRDDLIPVLMGFALTLAALPVLALSWGARVADLTELWTIFLRGFAIGETRISPADFLTFALIFALGYGVTRLLQATMRENILPKTRMDVGGQNAVVSGIGYVGIFLAALLAITGAGIDLSSIAIVAGALSVGIGFGLQTIVSNFVSGIILLVERPISEGDWIEVDGQMGYVRDISVRSTRIETFDRTDVIVPNADLVSGTVTNYTRGNTIGRLMVTVGVAYGTDTRRVDAVLMEIATKHPMVLRMPEPTVVFANFGGDALEFEVRMYLRDVNWKLSVKNDINHAIAERFKEEGIEIPFAQRDVWLRNPETLRADQT